MKTLVLSVDIGAGHRMAAEALCAAIAAARPGATHRVVEALDYLGPDGGKLAKEMYFGMLEDIPDLWGAIYDARGLHELLRPLGELLDDHRADGLAPLIHTYDPDLVLAMHPIACGLAGAIGRDRHTRCAVAAVLTDFDPHPSWVVGGIDLYLTATEEMAKALARHGLSGARAVATGIPLRPGFAAVREIADARARLGLDRSRFTILLLGGGLGLGPIGEVAAELARLEGPLQAVVIAGKNRELQAQTRAVAERARIPITVTGSVDNVWDFMSAADLAIGKPGGLTCAELLAAGVPMVALAPIPGQEQANCDVLVAAGVALAATSSSDAASIVRRLLGAPAEREAMRQRALRLGRPTAARAAANEVLALCRPRPQASSQAGIDDQLRAMKRKLGLD